MKKWFGRELYERLPVYCQFSLALIRRSGNNPPVAVFPCMGVIESC
jgi:hypothetical protein